MVVEKEIENVRCERDVCSRQAERWKMRDAMLKESRCEMAK